MHCHNRIGIEAAVKNYPVPLRLSNNKPLYIPIAQLMHIQ